MTRKTDTGFQPALVVETSPHDLQVCLNHGRTFAHKTSTSAAGELAKRLGGTSRVRTGGISVDLPASRIGSPKRRSQNRLDPFVPLRQCHGRTSDAADDSVEEVKSLVEKAVAQPSGADDLSVDAD